MCVDNGGNSERYQQANVVIKRGFWEEGYSREVIMWVVGVQTRCCIQQFKKADLGHF